jgi:hypothetical protein
MASREALFACALANTPKTVRVVRICKNLTGLSYLRGPNYGRLEAPRPVTRRALQVFLHECAHFALHDYYKIRPNKPRYLEEVEAEQWAFARMREAGIAVPRKALQEARDHVRDAIEKALIRGVRRIEPKAARFAGFKKTPAPRPWQRSLKLGDREDSQTSTTNTES